MDIKTKREGLHIDTPHLCVILGTKLFELVSNIDKNYEKITFICIGTDRCTGDSYGPLVGHNLSKVKDDRFEIYGTLKEPVHALNLDDTLNKIDNEKNLVISIDACLGMFERIGYIACGIGGIKPGSGVNKDLPMVGDMSITGIVNIGSFLPMMMLQNTSLHLVYRMAEETTNAIRFMFYLMKKQN